MALDGLVAQVRAPSPAARTMIVLPTTPSEDHPKEHNREFAELPERNLNILRTFAVLCVVANHILSTWPSRLFAESDVWTLGQLGVLVFFVHTALVLMASIERHGGKHKGWLQTFYVRRAFRIYPLSVSAVVLVMCMRIPAPVPVAGVVRPFDDVSLSTFASNLTLTQNLALRPSVLGVLWSLPLEVQMYLVLPYCYLIANQRRSSPIVALILLLMGTSLLVRTGFIPHMRRFWGLSFAPCFSGGVAAYHVARRGVRPFLPSFAWPLLIVATAAMFFALHPGPMHPERGWPPCLFLGAILPLVRDARPSGITTAAREICNVSYGIYLLHVPALWFSFVVLRSAPLAVQWMSFAGLAAALPWIAHRLIEAPGMRLGKIFAGRLGPAPKVGG